MDWGQRFWSWTTNTTVLSILTIPVLILVSRPSTMPSGWALPLPLLTDYFSRGRLRFTSPLYVWSEVASEHVGSQVGYCERQLSRGDNHTPARSVGSSGCTAFLLLHGLRFVRICLFVEKKDPWNFQLIMFVKYVLLLLMDSKLFLKKNCPPFEIITNYHYSYTC